MNNNMVKKLIRKIYRCDDCYYIDRYGGLYSKCILTIKSNRSIGRTIKKEYEIPKWCPLPNWKNKQQKQEVEG